MIYHIAQTCLITAFSMSAILSNSSAQDLAPIETVDHLKQIKPILVQRCAACHGALKQEAGLRLDVGQFVLKGGDDGAVVVPSDAASSRLLKRVKATSEAERMPPEGAPLTDDQIATLERWVSEGATVSDEPIPLDPRQHWAFVPPRRNVIPAIDSATFRSASPIDYFIEAEYRQLGLAPVHEADKSTLIRRVSLDLIGLPPTANELTQFLADNSEDAYERVVDRLLASPHYGERWGRHWMDVWRYSDWDGFKEQVRESQPHLWRWRDWIVQSLNVDKPYDRMVLEMLAADELTSAEDDAARATGFLVRNYNKFNRNIWLDNTVEHTSKALFGLTMNCCRCHDHKYDPIEQREYYRLRAVFEPVGVRIDPVAGQIDRTKDGLARIFDAQPETPTFLFARGDEKQAVTSTALDPDLPRVLSVRHLDAAPVNLKLSDYHPAARRGFQTDLLGAAERDVESARMSARQKVIANETQPSSPLVIEIAELVVREFEAKRASLAARLRAENASFTNPPTEDAILLATEASRAEQQLAATVATLESARVREKIAELKAGADSSNPDRLAALQQQFDQSEQKRIDAEAKVDRPGTKFTPVDETYPSTSTGRRLAFAREAVSHDNPLTARVAINHMWLRHFDSGLVSTVFDFGLNGKPPTHPKLLDWLALDLMECGWNFKPIHRQIVTSRVYRLSSSAGVVSDNDSKDRDNRMLWRANVKRMEAEIVRDSLLQLAGLLDTTCGGADLPPDAEGDNWRRSLYFRHSKEKRMLLVDVFDGASVTDCYRRNETVVPQQALALMNSRLSAICSATLAVRWKDARDEEFVGSMWTLILGRQATEAEQQATNLFLTQQANRLNGDRHAARQSLIRVLFNHNDFVSIR